MYKNNLKVVNGFYSPSGLETTSNSFKNIETNYL